MPRDEDEAEAVRWFRRGVELGVTAAVERLARCLADGVGGERDVEEARRLLRLALEEEENEELRAVLAQALREIELGEENV